MADATFIGTAATTVPSDDYLTNLETTRSNIAKRLVEITQDPKPSYMVNGQSVQWTAYHRLLTEMLERLNKMIQAGEVDATPFEEHMQAFS